ncbi:MAG: hypothetical protein NCW75_03315 [Phycisphaera sp.]|nr:MAG: hypothetical protein NCW75_03315 [Phycisphaera sp.]
MANERVPRTEAEFVPWLAEHVVIWSGGQGTPPSIGLTPTQVADLAALSADLDEKYQSMRDLVALKKAARVEKDTALAAARAMVGGDIEIIDGFAKTSGDPDVYARAQIDPPKPGTPRVEAPIPAQVTITSTTDGALEVTFKANKSGGSVFIIERQLVSGGIAGPWQYATTSTEKAWLDHAVPTGLDEVRYRIRTKLTNGVLSEWCSPVPFFMGTGSGSSAGSTASATDGDGLTIEDAQALKDAQTAKGADKAG